MKKIKLAKLPDRVPVKLTVTLPSELATRLRSYADVYAEQYGTHEEPAELVPYILDAFIKGDVEFQRAIREKGVKHTEDRDQRSRRKRGSDRTRRSGNCGNSPARLDLVPRSRRAESLYYAGDTP
jgi:hypothetical protein